jgi:diacylglycerol kinase (ATP)
MIASIRAGQRPIAEGDTPMPKYRLIVNPAAGAGTGGRSIPTIESLMKASGLPHDLVRTERRGHAIDLAREAALAGVEVVVACGGDGTSNEVINGLKLAQTQGHSAALGVLCVGRGNDFAFAVGVPTDLPSGVDTLVADARRTIDLGRVTGGAFPDGRFFGSCVGIGFDAVTTIEVSKMPRWGGFLSFFAAVLKTIFLYPYGPTVRLDVDGRTMTLPTLMVSVMNGRRLGGGFWMAPTAEPDDGLFDLCVARQASRRRILGLIPHFMKGTQPTQPEIQMLQGRKIVIEAVEGVLPAQTDGEIISTEGKRLDIEMLPGALQVVAPAAGAR